MIKLFSEPFDLDEIERALCEDSFLSLAHLTVGREENWRASVDQINRLLSVFEESGRDTYPVYRMISILVHRTAQLSKSADLMAEITMKMGLLPGVNFSRRPQIEMIAPSQTDKDKTWLENYRAKQHGR